MDKTAMFSLTYGLFLAGVQEGDKRNACIINTAVQATSEPPKMHVTMMKSNLTTQLIKRKGSLALSVLSLDCPLETIANFGLKRGRDSDKFIGFDPKEDQNGNPFLNTNTLAYMTLNVESMIDVGSHYLFICNVAEAEKINQGQPMTYADYRVLKAGGTVGKPSAKTKKQWVCTVCHYVYDGDIPFEELPEDWICPVCGEPKSVFVQEEI